jgi:hypothetical protein
MSFAAHGFFDAEGRPRVRHGSPADELR